MAVGWVTFIWIRPRRKTPHHKAKMCGGWKKGQTGRTRQTVAMFLSRPFEIGVCAILMTVIVWNDGEDSDLPSFSNFSMVRLSIPPHL